MPTATRSRPTGKCTFCQERFSKAMMTKHLGTCQKRQSSLLKASGQTTKLLHLFVQGRTQSDYWMHLEIPAQAKLEDLDGFLRSTWLECCGHLSDFKIEGEQYAFEPMDREEKNMAVPLAKVLRPGLVFYHDYDYGSTTELVLEVLGERIGAVTKKSIQVLARNEPPADPCAGCGKTAVNVCSDCDEPACSICSRKHECGSDRLLPLVNSPRAGVCGYEG